MRNQYAGTCYVCGLTVRAGTGHFEKYNGGWRVKHALEHNRSFTAVTCEQARQLAKYTLQEGRS